ncbi:hypothetical protein TNIN_496491 [Trichonephila inaurata madagascariensis]|uniref:Uncharacterized protein n=1 Tax=Trichonephila inaurata madagascariensis TaxID=2747483 RepID=A0A8X6X407_9ARAC|nr:hypothetical protein TNIN_496491 [Trichonephila inaurata madagascariensis]
MEIGCGDTLHCCKAILEVFPEVRSLVAIDKEVTTLQNANPIDPRIHLGLGNVEERIIITIISIQRNVDGNSTTNYWKKLDFIMLNAGK